MSNAQNRVNSLIPESSNSASETSPKEAQKSEVFIEDIDAETLAMMISFIYTGDFEVGDQPDVQMSDCDVSKRLAKRRQTRQELPLFSVSGNPPGKL